MTLLVRNESEIVKANIDFHLRMGVDHIFVTDNGSVDSTYAMLQPYESQGILTVINEPSQIFDQAAWVNRMADMAYRRFGRCLIFHCDADEFWHSASGNLKHELSCLPWVECLKVRVCNVLPLHRNFEERFPDDIVVVVDRPLTSKNPENDSRNKSFYLFEYPPKVMYRAKDHMPHVVDGNHALINRKTYFTRSSERLLIYHFPLRGYEHFERKIVEGGAAIMANPDLSAGIGWQWRRWYQAFQDGTLRSTYRSLVLDEREADVLSKQGVLQINQQIRDIFHPIPNGMGDENGSDH
jgi:hypothetical protein